MLTPAILHPGCKVNLYLRIQGLRPDGYHELRSIFYPLAHPHDTMQIRPGPAGCGFALRCSDSAISNETNILHRSYTAFAEKSGFSPDLEVSLEKRIPMGAGLGGGSSDAACFLLYLNRLAGQQGLNQEQLRLIARQLGADVPFFLLNRPAWAEGVGEHLRQIDLDLAKFHILLACPRVHVCTTWAYAAWDQAASAQTAPPVLTESLSQDKFISFAAIILHNSFEQVVFPVHPELRRLKERLLRIGASGVVMSGSGASVVSLFRDTNALTRAQEMLMRQEVPAFVQNRSTLS